ncbi:MAG: hypothetical protein A3F54_04880 [Candidatus Kerfeldbacteria bacterium RIFCSPHIGHO2_12_FULL_48_17]|uniref:Uncharacterized protein n=1 Tax=Candidatus Kerfeldbacteria bacterium RIFCSPHIGHO2_12_FULL_48_17 TaxID=1798542 RepID=A0A1G2B613_9BACT|nr:MAG: hypothetical protein A3F54_04880 [Candidatus Kerfeldbacteria bacterium RIFCSPHIGHO2_12_FULL_48_17]
MLQGKDLENFSTVDPLDRKFTQPASSIKSSGALADGSNNDDALGAVHTMPKRFLRAQPSEGGSVQPGSKRTKIILVVVIVAGVLGVAAFSAFFFRSLDANDAVVTPTNVNQNTNTRVGFSNTNKNAPAANNGSGNSNGNVTGNKNTNGVATNTNAGNTNSAAQPASSLDTDKDKLTDIEEDLYGTRFQKADSDSDGFPDGEEVANLYDPLGSGTLDHSPQVAKYSNILFSYTVLYPSAFKAEATSNSQDTILFTSSTGEFMETLTMANSEGLTARQWYLSQFPDQVNPKSITNKQALPGVLSVDGLTAYFADEKRIYAVSYHVGAREEQSFLTTFTMMYQSLDLVTADSTLSPTTGNTNSKSNANTNSRSNSNSNSNANSNSNKNANKNSNANSNKNTNGAGNTNNKNTL